LVNINVCGVMLTGLTSRSSSILPGCADDFYSHCLLQIVCVLLRGMMADVGLCSGQFTYLVRRIRPRDLSSIDRNTSFGVIVYVRLRGRQTPRRSSWGRRRSVVTKHAVLLSDFFLIPRSSQNLRSLLLCGNKRIRFLSLSL